MPSDPVRDLDGAEEWYKKAFEVRTPLPPSSITMVLVLNVDDAIALTGFPFLAMFLQDDRKDFAKAKVVRAPCLVIHLCPRVSISLLLFLFLPFSFSHTLSRYLSVSFFCDFQFYERALELSPSNTRILQSYSTMLAQMRDLDTAEKFYKRALQLDANSLGAPKPDQATELLSYVVSLSLSSSFSLRVCARWLGCVCWLHPLFT